MAGNREQSSDPVIWGVHAGRTGDGDALFLKNGCVALGWDQMGDLSTLAQYAVSSRSDW